MKKHLSVPTKLLVTLSILVFLSPFWIATAGASNEYAIDDVQSVAVVLTKPISKTKPDGEQQYLITLKDGSGHIVSRSSGSFSAFERAVHESGYVGDVEDLLALAEAAEQKDILRITLGLLQIQVHALQEQLRVAQAIQTDDDQPWCTIDWTRSMKLGDSGEDVRVLQKFLNAQTGISVSTYGDGAPGMESEYFGLKTAAALAQFQEQHASDILTPLKMTAGSGFFGGLTQAWIARSCGTETGTPLAIPLDRLNKESDSLCYSADTSFSEGTKANSYVAPNGLTVEIQNGYFRCESGQWEPYDY